MSENSAQELDISFFIGKARVTPVKHHAIPKLEFMAASTGNRLKNAFLAEYKIDFEK